MMFVTPWNPRGPSRRSDTVKVSRRSARKGQWLVRVGRASEHPDYPQLRKAPRARFRAGGVFDG